MSIGHRGRSFHYIDHPRAIMVHSQMKVSTRLGLGFGLVLLLLAAIAGLGIFRLAGLHTAVDTLADHRVPNLVTSYEWQTHLQDTGLKMRNILLLSDPSEIRAQLDAIHEDELKRKEAMEKLQASITLAEGKAHLQEVLDARAAYLPSEHRFLSLVESGDMASARTVLLEDARPLQIANIEALDKLIEFEAKVVEDDSKVSAEEYRSGSFMLILLSLLALVTGSVAAWLITRSLVLQLGGEPHYAAEIARSIAAGQLDVRIESRANDDSSLIATMRSMRDHLLDIVSQVRRAANSVRSGTSQLSQGNDDLSQRTQEQASALEETAASMEEMTITVKQNADNARQTAQRVTEMRSQAENGGQIVQRAVNAMTEINSSSNKIADIIGVIDEIAFQTNLLALNAAVEAARAGEQGRGFAVVASEVRNLAQRSATAAKEIKGLITESVDKVRDGSDLVDQSGKALTDIITSVRKVADIVAEITAASEEQAAGIEQVNNAVTQMDTMTQQNAALVEESTATSKSIEQQAQALVSQIAFFRTGHNDDRNRAFAAPASRAPVRIATPAPAVRRHDDLPPLARASGE
ncbi:methyl-accepting chemotaxis protein [Povalibacter uvarum]|uniref:Methyl-accepting chemotaxis protein n=1 Tax=Povalibacter uvarum TaxID=732238 RepID=A0A841HLY0_9GAMM|nr:methyl-accepting chemotaxis protein [Povalibacter uvarum]MBB6093290.1 methyl-accepting chemotaxis protein [Povalibacter uvarum]